MTECLSILGSTGSIGIQTLDVAEKLNIKVEALCANSNIDLLEQQARKFKPVFVAVADMAAGKILQHRLFGSNIKVFFGEDGVIKTASSQNSDTVVAAMVGMAGLLPILEAIKAGKKIALANKETLVTGGKIVMQEAQSRGVSILPVDSEHSAIFQCLWGNSIKDVKKIILTASGGPFRTWSIEDIRNASVEQALRHPNWDMGKKITIDSATLMNKGLEVIEARWLFGLMPEQIDVIIHPQSIVHSMVEYKDGSIIAQLGMPDMRMPIQIALAYPNRADYAFSTLDLITQGKLEFERPDMEKFPCLSLAYEALAEGGLATTVLNSANEVCVSLFIENKIKFYHISLLIKKCLEYFKYLYSENYSFTLNDIIETDRKVRQFICDCRKEID